MSRGWIIVSYCRQLMVRLSFFFFFMTKFLSSRIKPHKNLTISYRRLWFALQTVEFFNDKKYRLEALKCFPPNVLRSSNRGDNSPPRNVDPVLLNRWVCLSWAWKVLWLFCIFEDKIYCNQSSFSHIKVRGGHIWSFSWQSKSNRRRKKFEIEL